MKFKFAPLKFICFLVLLQITALTGAAQTQSSTPQEVTFETADGVKVYADIYLSGKGKKAPLIMLFHQGGGNSRGEYGSYIAPKL